MTISLCSRSFRLLVGLACGVAYLHASPDNANAWRVRPNTSRSELDISHDRLGLVVEHLTLWVRTAHGDQQASDWVLQSNTDREVRIHSRSAHATWSVRTTPEFVTFSTTSPDGFIRAQVPATADRIVARGLDPEGVPVTWQGTSEVKATYGGSKTQQQSFLPRENPDVMYFGLGQISGPMFHSVFDRRTDTLLDFGAGSSLIRNRQNPNTLDLTVPVAPQAAFRITPDYFTTILKVPFYTPLDDTYFKTAPMVWSSWTAYYEGVTENDIVRNADWLAANLQPYGFQYVQLDDGYDRDASGAHSWISGWDRAKFPHGPEWLTHYIRSKGLRAGIWLVPNAYAAAVKDHPDWYLRTRDGKLIDDYSTPSLDSSNPAVIALVKHIFATLDDWGFDYYKLDGEHAMPAYVPTVDPSKLFDRRTDPVQVYRHRFAAIRETIGPERFLEVCPAGTPLNAIGYANSYFNGDDLFANWQGMYPLFSSINANAFLNHLAVYLMPGEGLELGEPMTVEEARAKHRPLIVGRENPPTGIGTTLAEARTVVSYVALTGVTYPLASVMPELPAERTELVKETMPTLPIIPVDLFSRGTDMEYDTFKNVHLEDYVHTYPQILDLKVNASLGQYDVAAFTNWTQADTVTDVSLTQKLGLDPNRSFIAFDFWNRQLLGKVRGQLRLPIPLHDTRVLLIHPDLGHPQLIGTSRHITGSYSVSDVNWDAETRTLSGTSQPIAGAPYDLWIYTPERAALKSSHAEVNGAAVPIRPSIHGQLVTLSFIGPTAEPVRWQVQF